MRLPACVGIGVGISNKGPPSIGADRESKMLSFRLTPAPPFRLDLTAWVLRRRPNNGWDLWDRETYRRVLVIEGVAVQLSVAQLREKLVVGINGPRIPPRAKEQAVAALRRFLGIDVDLSAFYRFARSDRRLAQLAERFHGFKPPRFLSVFEGLVGCPCDFVTRQIDRRALSPQPLFGVLHRG